MRMCYYSLTANISKRIYEEAQRKSVGILEKKLSLADSLYWTWHDFNKP